MTLKTKITAEDGKQDMLITREFDLPVSLLFRAYTEAELVEQWMGTKVLTLETKQHGRYQFETSNPQGIVVLKMNGVIHNVIPEEMIIRTFEMENTPYPVQLEFLKFEKLTVDTSRLTMHVIYKSPNDRDEILKLPFAKGINMAHNRLEEILKK